MVLAGTANPQGINHLNGELLKYWKMLISIANVSKIHDPSSLQVQKNNKMKYDTQTKMVSYDLAHTR